MEEYYIYEVGGAKKRLVPSTPQTTDIYVNCAGIEEVSCGSGGFRQHVHLSDVCVEDIIQNIGSETFFNAFDNEELAEHLRKYGYEVKKNDR